MQMSSSNLELLSFQFVVHFLFEFIFSPRLLTSLLGRFLDRLVLWFEQFLRMEKLRGFQSFLLRRRTFRLSHLLKQTKKNGEVIVLLSRYLIGHQSEERLCVSMIACSKKRFVDNDRDVEQKNQRTEIISPLQYTQNHCSACVGDTGKIVKFADSAWERFDNLLNSTFNFI